MKTQRTRQMLLAIAVLALTAGARVVWADGPGAGYSGTIEGKVQYIDRALHVIDLADGTELWATNAQQLHVIQAGHVYRFGFVQDFDKNLIQDVQPVQPATR